MSVIGLARQRLRALAVVTMLAGALAACGEQAVKFKASDITGMNVGGDFALTDHTGKPRTLGDFKGKVVVLFFGYTHCPDVCPLHMANIAAVLRRMPAEDRARVVTVFVTTDPERDTPMRLREWLANFDASFVGLTGTKDELARSQLALDSARRRAST